MRLSECRGQACLNYAEREHLRRSQLEMRSCHTGCKNHETKKREELFELTGDNYHLTTTLPLRTFYLTMTSEIAYCFMSWIHAFFCLLWSLSGRNNKCSKFYEWDPIGCMGETPTPVWVRYQHVYGWDTSIAMGEQTGCGWNGWVLTPNGAPRVILDFLK